MLKRDSNKVRIALMICKVFLAAVLIYVWVWGNWDIHSFVDVVVTIIGVAALLLVW